MSSASAIFPASPPADNRLAPFMARSLSGCPVTPFLGGSFWGGRPAAHPASIRRCYSAVAPPLCNCTGRRLPPGLPSRPTRSGHQEARRLAAALPAGQLLPGTAAPHAGRAFCHDVRPRTGRLVTGLDQDPAPLSGTGQREASRELAAMKDERDVPRFIPEDLGGSLVPDNHGSAAARLPLADSLELAGG